MSAIVPCKSLDKKEIEETTITRLLMEIHKFNHLNYDLDEEQRIVKFKRLHNRVKQIRDIISALPREEKDLTDIRILNTQIPLFSWAYYGLNIKELAIDMISIYKDIFEPLINKINNYYGTVALCRGPYKNGEPYIKVLFVSERLNRFSSVLRDRGGIIKKLTENKDFVIDVMTNTPINDNVKHLFSNVNMLIPFTENIEKNIQMVGNGRYDIIVYPDLHMDGRSSFMSLCRLARVQINTFGHSDTSGTADFFISSELYETNNSQDNYTEKLIKLKSLNTYYSKTLTTEQRKTLNNGAYFSLSPYFNYYLCSSSPFKFGYEMIEIFKGILAKDSKAKIILTKLDAKYDIPLFNLLCNELKEEIDRIIFMNRLSTFDLLNLNCIAKVCLESVPFGNLNTSLECFEVGMPVVCLVGNKINNRFTYGFYEKMGLQNEYCFYKVEDYVNKAVEIGTEDIDYYKQRRDEIETKAQVLFNEEESYEDWVQLLKSL